MPYQRRYGRRKQTRRRQPRKSTYARTLYQGASTATKALAMAKSAVSTAWKLKGIINSEKKKFDSVMGGAANIDTAGSLVLNTIAISQGDTINNRTGNSILCKYVSVRGTFFLGSVLQNAICQIYVVQDNQQVGDTPPAFGDVFTQNFGHCLLNAANVGRFTLLASKTVSLQAASGLSQPVSFDLPLDHHVRYNGTTGTDIQKGGIFVFVLSDLAPASANKPTFSGWSRLTYYDN